MNRGTDTESLEIWNCLNCRRRKLRCDRHQPCAPCLRKNLQCLFPNSGRLPHRNRIADNAKPPIQKRVELLNRLRRLEAMVGDLSSQVEEASVAGDQKLDSASEGSTETRESSSDTSNTSTTYVSENRDGELVVGDPFWSIFCKEVEHIFEAVNGPTAIDLDKHMNINVGSENRLSYYNFLRTHTSAPSNTEVLRPMPSQMPFIWQIYVDNVDPFIKVLHKPTIVQRLYSLKGGFESLGSSTEALLLVMAFAAVTTLGNEEIMTNFNVTKPQLVSGYKLAAESALAKADMIGIPDLVTLQAHTIYLSVIEHMTSAGIVWRLNAILVRVAVSLGIHREDSQNKGSQLESEQHRRLWWQICLLDSSSGTTSTTEFSLSENIFNTNLPLNIDDTNLQDSTEPFPDKMDSYSDTSIFLLRCQIWKFCQKLQRNLTKSSPWTLISSLQQFRTSIQNSRLVHCQANESLHRFVQTTTRLFLNRIELMIHIKQNPAKSHSSPSSHVHIQMSYDTKILDLSTSITEDIHALQHDPHWKGWRWQIKGSQPPWRCLHLILEHLHKYSRTLDHRHRRHHDDRALSAVKTSLQSTPEEFRSQAQYQQLSRLLAQVEKESHQSSILIAEGASSENVPADAAVIGEFHSLSTTLSVVDDAFFDSVSAHNMDPTPSTSLRSDLDKTGESVGNDIDFTFTLEDQSWDFARFLNMEVDADADLDGTATWDPLDLNGL